MSKLILTEKKYTRKSLMLSAAVLTGPNDWLTDWPLWWFLYTTSKLCLLGYENKTVTKNKKEKKKIKSKTMHNGVTGHKQTVNTKTGLYIHAVWSRLSQFARRELGYYRIYWHQSEGPCYASQNSKSIIQIRSNKWTAKFLVRNTVSDKINHISVL